MIRLLFGLALVLGLVGCGDPDPNGGASGDDLPWRDEGRGVALVAAAGATHDFGWIDLLDAVFGSIDVLDVDDVTRWAPSLADRSVLWIGHDTLRRIPPDRLTALQGFLGAGGTVVLEAPDETWASGAGIRIATAERRDVTPWPTPTDAGALFGDGPHSGRTARAPVRSVHDLPPARIDAPVSIWRYAPSRELGTPARPWIDAAGRPAVWSLDVGSGAMVSIAYGLARWSVEIRQGDGLVPVPALPARDAWLSRLLESDTAAAPWPRWSTTPAGVDTWLVPDGDESAARPLGFARGTGLPLRALDDAGRPTGELRLPATGTATSADALRRHLANAATVLGGPVRVALAGDVDLSSLPDTVSTATATAWWKARARARVNWSDTGTWIASVATPDLPVARAHGFALLLPTTWRDEVLVGWSATWSPAPVRRVLRGGRPWLEIGVPGATEGRLHVEYRPRRSG